MLDNAKHSSLFCQSLNNNEDKRFIFFTLGLVFTKLFTTKLRSRLEKRFLNYKNKTKNDLISFMLCAPQLKNDRKKFVKCFFECQPKNCSFMLSHPFFFVVCQPLIKCYQSNQPFNTILTIQKILGWHLQKNILRTSNDSF